MELIRHLYIGLITAFLLFSAECYAVDGRIHLENGLKAYREEADFDKAISELQEAIQQGLANQNDLVQAYLYLGFAYIGTGQRAPAEVEFEKAIRLDSTLSLDPKVYSAKILTVFNEIRERLVDSLTVISSPGEAEVYVDGEVSAPAGTTPLRLDDVLVGEHTLRIVKKFFHDRVSNVRVEKGKNNRIQVELDKRKYKLIVNSLPVEAAVYIAVEGIYATEPYGITPVTLTMVLDQELMIRLSKEEFLDREIEIKLTVKGFSTPDGAAIPVEDGKLEISLKPAPPPGSLIVTSDPPCATVYLDGIARGETPLTLQKITPGIRSLRIGLPGFASAIEKVEVISGKEIAINVTLGGRLLVSSIPDGAQVFIDERFAGITPFQTERIPGGTYQLRFAREGFRDRIAAVVLAKGQEKAVETRLIPVKGSIAISSDPPGAAVYLDGENKGNTPVFIYGVMAGQHLLELIKPGYADWQKQITVEELKVSWYSGKLEAQ